MHRVSKKRRRQMVIELRQRGWSLQRIGEKLGLGKSTIGRDLQGGPNGTPEGATPLSITGKDGKSYPVKGLKPPAERIRERASFEAAKTRAFHPRELFPKLRPRKKLSIADESDLVLAVNSAAADLTETVEHDKFQELLQVGKEHTLRGMREALYWAIQALQIALDRVDEQVTEETDAS